MSEELTMDQKMAMVREAKPSYAKNELIDKWQEAGRMINSERREETRKALMQSVLFDKTVGTKLPLHSDDEVVRRDSGTTSQTGAFFGLYVDGNGHTYLQGGTVTGGNGGSETRADIKVIDAEDGPVEAAGTVLYLHANCQATVSDGIMLPGCELLSTGVNTTPGVNHTFTVAADTGYLHEEIGRWNAVGFLPAGTGNFLASGCIGNFALTRI
jgi:hypothetical protein